MIATPTFPDLAALVVDESAFLESIGFFRNSRRH
jgi:hypothetical protein